MNDFIRKLAGNPLENYTCAIPPFGCGKSVNKHEDFKDALSLKEYNISGLCQTCQDAFFDANEAPEPYQDDSEQFELNNIAADHENE